MFISKIPVLDKGYVAKFDSSGDSAKLNELAVEFFKKLDGKFLAPEISSLTLLVKCPLFVQLNFSTFSFRISNLPNVEPLEAYLPHVGEIGAQNLDVSTAIVDSISHTTTALLINPKAYQADGCDRFVSQILTPINTYTTILIHGMYNDWCRYIAQNNTPTCIKAYIDAITSIVQAEWQ